MLQIRNFSKSYHDQKVLDISSYDFTPALYWIKGKNGSGKSTLLKSVAGIIPFEGDIEIDKISVKKQPITYRNLVNYADAEPFFPDFLTLKDLTIFVGKALKAGKEQQESLVQYFKMEPFYNQPMGTYSTGMLKKAGLILAFLGMPQIILLDEPYSFLDHDSVDILHNLILKRYDSQQTTFLISSHIEEKRQLPYHKILQIEKATIKE